MAETIKGIRVIDVQADEIWQFVYCKQATALRKKIAGGVGDSYCFTAIERGSKLLVAWHLGRRSDMDTAQFCEKLAIPVVTAITSFWLICTPAPPREPKPWEVPKRDRVA